MRFASWVAEGKSHYGAITDTGAIALDTAFPQWATLLDVVKAGGLGQLSAALEGRPDTHTDFHYTMILPDAHRILCVGVNFPDRNAEYKDGSELPAHMSLFPRFASGFTGHERPLIRPPESPQLDYEGEVAIVLGKGGRRIAEADAYDHIAALTICNEGTIRDWVRHAKFNVTQGKNWDNSGAMGPWLVPFSDAAQLNDARIITRVNGEVRQDDTLARMMFPIRRQIAYISTFMTLQQGDRADVLAATDYVAPSLEILDTRIVRHDPETGATRKVYDTVGDNAANAGVVLGEARHSADIDLRCVGAIVCRNGEVEETGLGAAVLSDPVQSVVWLARRMAEYGQSISPGQIILSGSFIRPVECLTGSEIFTDFGSFGSVGISFS